MADTTGICVGSLNQIRITFFRDNSLDSKEFSESNRDLGVEASEPNAENAARNVAKKVKGAQVCQIAPCCIPETSGLVLRDGSDCV
jgi:hypothetical protein